MDTATRTQDEDAIGPVPDPELGLPVGENSSRVHAEDAAAASPKPAGGLGRRKSKGKGKASASTTAAAAKSKKEAKKAALRNDIDFIEHTWPEDQLYTHYGTSPEKGLPSAQVLVNREKYGRNMLTPPKTKPAWVKYLEQYKNFFAVLLIVASTLCFIAFGVDSSHDKTNLYLGIVLLLVVVITASFSYLQESKSEAVMEGFKKLIPARCHVIRDGLEVVIDAVELVPGDVVNLNDGDRVPADIRIIRANELKVDNSSLTGESEAVERTPELARDRSGNLITQPLEASNLCFYTTIVQSGSGRGIVIGSGDRTVMGQIAGLATETNNAKSPIAVEIEKFVQLIAYLAIGMGVLFFILSLVIGNGVIYTVVFAIGVIVANVPEGLMPAVTVSMALAAKRMHAKNVLVKNLQSVETLGSTTVIASDKTGTLTQNRMTVQHCWYDNQIFDTPAPKNKTEWSALFASHNKTRKASCYDPSSPTFAKLQMVASLCNNASFLTSTSSGVIDLDHDMLKPDFNLLALDCSGDASEQGLTKFVEPIRATRDYRDKNPKLFEIKFNSTNKWQVSIHKQEAGGSPLVLVMKGAPERVLQRCSKIMMNGVAHDLTDETREQYQTAYEQMGGFGERVLGFAYREMEEDETYPFSNKPEPNFETDGLTFVGLISLIDPPRDGVPEAVAKCKRARIKVFMVTGDHPITARAIALQVGILDQEKLDSGRAAVISGDDIRGWLEMTDKLQAQRKWDEALDHDQLVWARVSPAHKLLIVENCQRRGEIVAVTGDGVNDAPALKKGDVGIAMGISGKDVSKEAADMILMDDNFASIVNGVEEGRLIFDNLKKTICYALAVNIPELIPFLLYVLIQIPLPLSTVIMLLICLGTDMVPAISLAYEEKESDIMDRPPRNAKTERLVGWKLISHAYPQIGIYQCFAGFLAYLVVLNDYGYPPRVLFQRGLNWSTNALMCTVDANNVPIECGYGCNNPDYAAGLASALDYCKDGCTIPMQAHVGNFSDPVDPFSEFNYGGYKGPAHCSLTCNSSPSLFPGGVLPAQCADPLLAARIGFPNRGDSGSPQAPVGAFYWWGGRQQLWPNVEYAKQALMYAQTAYFVAVLLTQWTNLLICKTRKLSIFEQGMNNGVLNFGLVFETVVAIIVAYVPGVQDVFGTRPLWVLHWFIGLPFAIVFLFYGEIRKYLLRKNPGGWVDRFTYW
ncbi:Ca2+ transporting ATPase [Klebsormidium nitens]|uniref:Ca2+ transporting ATPase n=1 Tax=Klebsormidium nitens TaxID=105231 RepID=A0A1Y1I8I8_KLENI|nr:Ca2+ transporting ATPase [Klebsormidium nitens]|eukprot:GAQ85006.1 Ca2+ transporting ATPase [Klebsormidium nitens]